MKRFTRISRLGLLMIAGLMITWGCQQKQESAPQSETRSQSQYTHAIAILHSTEGNEVQGVVTFTQTREGVKVVADITGLSPGAHGFHIHEYGDCSSPDGTSAGGHFNPEGVSHGAPDSQQRHIGDLGNITADENGNAHYERVDSFLSLNGPHSIVGRGVIIHAKADDLTSQPTGAAGARLACGVIGVAKAQ